MKKLDRTGWALAVVAVILLAVLLWTVGPPGCAIKRWERRIDAVQDTLDSTKDVLDASKDVVKETKEVTATK